MENKNSIQMGGILFFIGFILVLISWQFSFPIQMSRQINVITFFQFYPSIWPGLIFLFVGIFLVGYNSKKKLITALCSCFFPILFYISLLFFSYVPTSDSGNARSMFYIFHNTGIDSNIIQYFEFPIYFSLNEIIRQITTLDEKGIAFFSFIFYGVLLGFFLYIFYVSIKKYTKIQIKPFFITIVYFIGLFLYLNYQWVPQTLALVLFFLLLFLSTKIPTFQENIFMKSIFLLVFFTLVLTHAFIPAFFILYILIIAIKDKNARTILLILTSIFIVFTIYRATSHLSIYIATIRQSLYGFGHQYSSAISMSFQETEGLLNQLISEINRIRVPAVLLISFIGSIMFFRKKKIPNILMALVIAGGVYLIIGLFYSILGMRALQIIFVPMTLGFLYFLTRWKKPTLIIVTIILILSIFGPMRLSYDNTQFQTDEEVMACNFLIETIEPNTYPSIALGQVNFGYFTNMFSFQRSDNYSAIRPGSQGFSRIFNITMKQNKYVLFNSNLGKEIILWVYSDEVFSNQFKQISENNYIFNSGTTQIIKGKYQFS